MEILYELACMWLVAKGHITVNTYAIILAIGIMTTALRAKKPRATDKRKTQNL